MQVFFQKVFDNYISGTANVYTDTSISELLGSVESLSVVARARGVTGTSPTVTLQFENSPDGTRWTNQAGAAEFSSIMATGIDNDFAPFKNGSSVPISNRVRLRITLGGTSPACILILWVLGRSPAL